MKKNWIPYRGIACLLIGWLIFCPVLYAGNVSKGPAPSWVDTTGYDLSSTLSEEDLFGGVVFLLSDRQIKVENTAQYKRKALVFTNSEGLEEFSEISVSFDPSYQKVIFHEVKLKRAGEWIDKLATTTIQTLQRELEADRHIYDGTETAMIRLSDVRRGDLLEYSYTVIGRNPLFKGKFFGTWYLSEWYPISDMRLRFVAPADRKLDFNTYPEDRKGEVAQSGPDKVYQWNARNVIPAEWEYNMPSHINLLDRLVVTEMKNWSEVVQWALRHFQTSSRDQQAIQDLLPELTKDQASTLEYGTSLTKWVQNEIRYLGLESGIGGYKPRAPAKVIADRFGDCKDKSLLLSEMLQAKGIKAWPMLVHSSLGKALPEALPHPLNFNHCVVYVEYADTTFTIDPTINMQGDLFGEMYCPDYGWGLVIRKNENYLTKLSGNGEYFVRFEAEIDMHGPGDPVDLQVVSTYHGEAADNLRQLINAQSEKELASSYKDFYERFFNQVEPKGNLRISDTDSKGNNKITIVEQYLVKDMWKPVGDTSSGNWQIEITPYEILEYMYSNPNSGRKYPLALRYPLRVEHHIEFKLDQPQAFPRDVENTSGPGFAYSLRTFSLPGKTVLDYSYEILKPEIPADSVDLFYKKHEAFQSQMVYFVQQAKAMGSRQSKWGWLTYLLTASSFFVLIWAYWKWGWQYDPRPKIPVGEGRPIGGWVILPILGLCISAISTLVQLASGGYLFSHFELDALLSSDPNVSDLSYGAFGVFTSLLSILVFVVMVGNIILIFKRRSNVPRLMALHYVLNFLLVAVFSIGAIHFQSEGYQIEPLSGSVWFGRLFALAVWMPFFLVSHQSQGTFVVALKNHHVAPPRPKSSTPPDIPLPTPPPIPGLEEEE